MIITLQWYGGHYSRQNPSKIHTKKQLQGLRSGDMVAVTNHRKRGSLLQKTKMFIMHAQQRIRRVETCTLFAGERFGPDFLNPQT